MATALHDSSRLVPSTRRQPVGPNATCKLSLHWQFGFAPEFLRRNIDRLFISTFHTCKRSYDQRTESEQDWRSPKDAHTRHHFLSPCQARLGNASELQRDAGNGKEMIYCACDKEKR